MNIAIIDYGAGNIQSLKFAMERLGYQAELTGCPTEIYQADKVIFPGVGAAGSAMAKLRESKLDLVIPKLEQPVLGVCLGMQLMCTFSEENNTQGLGIFDIEVRRFTNQVKVPQIGWNQISDLKSELFSEVANDAYIYMVHSYYAETCEHTIAKSDYDVVYSAALRKDNFYGTQFHPEKSGPVGEQILKNFLKL